SRASSINLVVTTITKVADQTNLLSVNAAIEAEKAGEYGLGFLVVAREIRRLADQAAVATLDIEEMVRQMHAAVSAGVMEMDKFDDEVRSSVSSVQTVSGQLGGVIEQVEELNGRFDALRGGMRSQALGADQINDAMSSLAAGAEQTETSMRELDDVTGGMRDVVVRLRREFSRAERAL
ncbi:MAG: methyl-accepting chemotaxis protein, partial [Myxococcales bacterium]